MNICSWLNADMFTKRLYLLNVNLNNHKATIIPFPEAKYPQKS